MKMQTGKRDQFQITAGSLAVSLLLFLFSSAVGVASAEIQRIDLCASTSSLSTSATSLNSVFYTAADNCAIGTDQNPTSTVELKAVDNTDLDILLPQGTRTMSGTTLVFYFAKNAISNFAISGVTLGGSIIFVGDAAAESTVLITGCIGTVSTLTDGGSLFSFLNSNMLKSTIAISSNELIVHSTVGHTFVSLPSATEPSPGVFVRDVFRNSKATIVNNKFSFTGTNTADNYFVNAAYEANAGNSIVNVTRNTFICQPSITGTTLVGVAAVVFVANLATTDFELSIVYNTFDGVKEPFNANIQSPSIFRFNENTVHRTGSLVVPVDFPASYATISNNKFTSDTSYVVFAVTLRTAFKPTTSLALDWNLINSKAITSRSPFEITMDESFVPDPLFDISISRNRVITDPTVTTFDAAVHKFITLIFDEDTPTSGFEANSFAHVLVDKNLFLGRLLSTSTSFDAAKTFDVNDALKYQLSFVFARTLTNELPQTLTRPASASPTTTVTVSLTVKPAATSTPSASRAASVSKTPATTSTRSLRLTASTSRALTLPYVRPNETTTEPPPETTTTKRPLTEREQAFLDRFVSSASYRLEGVTMMTSFTLLSIATWAFSLI